MNKKKIIIIASIIVVLLIVALVVIVVVKKPSSTEGPQDNKVENNNAEVTDKLNEYIATLTDNYYIKYSGKFKNNSGEYIDAMVEYTKAGNNFALKSTELDMHMICEGENLYTVSNKYKLIIQMGRKNFDISEYNWVSNIGQTFVESYEENINSTKYFVEEYLFNGKSLKYYFKENEIKFVNYDGNKISVLRVEKSTDKELLIKPEGYAYAIS